MMITTTIRKDANTQEWIVRVRKDGKRMPEYDYFTDSKQDAEDTAKAMREGNSIIPKAP